MAEQDDEIWPDGKYLDVCFGCVWWGGLSLPAGGSQVALARFLAGPEPRRLSFWYG